MIIEIVVGVVAFIFGYSYGWIGHHKEVCEMGVLSRTENEIRRDAIKDVLYDIVLYRGDHCIGNERWGAADHLLMKLEEKYDIDALETQTEMENEK